MIKIRFDCSRVIGHFITVHRPFIIIISCNMGTSDFYLTRIPKARGMQSYKRAVGIHITSACICNNSSKANSLNANTSVVTGLFLYAFLKDSIMVRCGYLGR